MFLIGVGMDRLSIYDKAREKKEEEVPPTALEECIRDVYFPFYYIHARSVNLQPLTSHQRM
jgi:hypothetical protein